MLYMKKPAFNKILEKNFSLNDQNDDGKLEFCEEL